MTRRVAIAAIVLLGVAAAQEPVIRGGIDLVDLLITVRDKKGMLVKNLEQADFTVLEDGKEQPIRRFARETDLPLTIGLLIDVSGSVAEEIAEERRAARLFFNQVLRPQDQAFVISFGRESVLLQDLTGSIVKLQDALEDLGVEDNIFVRGQSRRFLSQFQFPGQSPFPGPFPGGSRIPRTPPIGGPTRGGGNGGQIVLGGTVLYDAVFLASDEILRPAANRKAIILISDGEDRGSKVTLTRALEAVAKADTIIYSIFVKPDRRGSGDEDVMERLASETGGRMFRLQRRNLDKIFQEISDELRSQYSLSYASANPARDGGFRRIALRMKNKDHIAQTRSGYYARTGGSE